MRRLSPAPFTDWPIDKSGASPRGGGCLRSEPAGASGHFVVSEGASREEPCQPGTFASGSGNVKCSDCNAGSYSDTVAASTCTRAKRGHYVDEPRATSQKKCEAGRFASAEGSSSCSPANAGFFVGDGGAAAEEQTRCPSGTFSATGATTCEACARGTFSAAGDASCTSCPAGSSSEAGSTGCSKCERGTSGLLSRTLFRSSDSHGSVDSEAGEGLSALSSEPTDRSALSRSLSWRASAPNLGHQAARKGGRAPL